MLGPSRAQSGAWARAQSDARRARASLGLVSGPVLQVGPANQLPRGWQCSGGLPPQLGAKHTPLPAGIVLEQMGLALPLPVPWVGNKARAHMCQPQHFAVFYSICKQIRMPHTRLTSSVLLLVLCWGKWGWHAWGGRQGFIFHTWGVCSSGTHQAQNCCVPTVFTPGWQAKLSGTRVRPRPMPHGSHMAAWHTNTTPSPLYCALQLPLPPPLV